MAQFLDSGNDRILSVTHVPKDRVRGAVMICSSILTDTILNYRREVEVSRSLARQGFLVGRFHYRGSGHSDGEPADSTFNGMIDDALVVTEHLRTFQGARSIGVVGSRWGALVAAGLANHLPSAPVAVWDPVLAGRSFLNEALQVSGIARMTSGVAGPSPKDSLAANGVADILGFPLSAGLYESGQSLSLVELFGSHPRRVLYLGPKIGTSLPKPDADAVHALRSNGLDLSIAFAGGPKAWWFVDDFNPTPLDAVATTAEWFATVMSGKE